MRLRVAVQAVRRPQTSPTTPARRSVAQLDVRRVVAAHEPDLDQPPARRDLGVDDAARPSADVASGFSHRVGLPAARQASTSSSCSGSGAAIEHRVDAVVADHRLG